MSPRINEPWKAFGRISEQLVQRWTVFSMSVPSLTPVPNSVAQASSRNEAEFFKKVFRIQNDIFALNYTKCGSG